MTKNEEQCGDSVLASLMLNCVLFDTSGAVGNIVLSSPPLVAENRGDHTVLVFSEGDAYRIKIATPEQGIISHQLITNEQAWKAAKSVDEELVEGDAELVDILWAVLGAVDRKTGLSVETL